MAELTLWHGRDHKEGSITVHGDVPDLQAAEGFGDVISGATVVSGTWTLFTDKNFNGKSVTVSIHGGPDSNGDYPKPDHLGGLEDTFSSVKLNSEAG